MSVAIITPVPEPKRLKLSALSAHSAAPFGAQSVASSEPELALPQAPYWARQPKAKVATSRLTTLPGRSGLTPRMLTAKADNRLHENQLAANVGQVSAVAQFDITMTVAKRHSNDGRQAG